jgi:diguanylate cyclase
MCPVEGALAADDYKDHAMLHNLVIVVHSISMAVALILLLSFMKRSNMTRIKRDVLTGALFGIGATVAMLDPMVISDGIQIDGRNLFIAFAGAISGMLGAVLAAAIAIATRVALGGPGVAVGVSAIFAAAVVGVIWWRIDKRRFLKSGWRWIGFAVLLCASIPLLLLLPGEAGPKAFVTGGPYLAFIYLGGIMLIGSVLDNEYRFLNSHVIAVSDAETDPLTGALNRRGFERQFEARLVEKLENRCFVMMLDLDSFKDINDRYGHDAGDAILKAVVNKVRSVIRSEDLIARVGGDEFAVCLFDLDESQCKIFVEKLELSLQFSIPWRHDEKIIELNVNVSTGGIYSRESRPDLSSLLNIADKKMMSSKYEFKKLDNVAMTLRTQRS